MVNSLSYNNHLLLLLLVLTAFLFFFSTGFVFYDPFDLNHFSHTFFNLLCHQFHWRTYSINELYMATCSRCFGIYSGMFCSFLIIMALRKKNKTTFSHAFILLTTVFLINFIDIIGNFLGLWTNTLHSRMILGLLFGFAIINLILTSYFIQTKKQTYGTT